MFSDKSLHFRYTYRSSALAPYRSSMQSSQSKCQSVPRWCIQWFGAGPFCVPDLSMYLSKGRINGRSIKKKLHQWGILNYIGLAGSEVFSLPLKTQYIRTHWAASPTEGSARWNPRLLNLVPDVGLGSY